MDQLHRNCAVRPQDRNSPASIEAHRTDDLRSIEELRAVHRASVRLQHALKPQDLAAETILVLEETLGYELGAVLLIDPSSGRLTPFALSDQQRGPDFVEQDRQNIIGFDVRLGHGVTGWVAANGKTVRSGDISRDPRYLAIRSGIASELCVPMLVRGNVIGVVNVETSRPNAYSESDERVMEIIASQIAVAIENSRLQQALLHSQRLDAIGRLTSGIAHDFNNMQTIIAGYADIILARDDLASTVREGVEQIKIAGKQSAEITQQLLAFGRKTVLRTAVLDPNEEIVRLETMLQRLLGDNVRLTIRGESVGKVEVDPTQFAQVMVNLAVNAREAMPEGGRFCIVTTTAVITDSSVQRFPGTPPGRYAIITVTDTGNGMDESTQQSLFEPFFSTKAGGTGLGLAMAYGFIRQSGGGIAVQSKPGHGARFEICLPIVQPVEADSNSLTTPHAVKANAGRILVVDDEESVRRVVAALLRNFGYSVVTAESGNEALEIFSRPGAGIGAVVSDIVMPGMDGPTLVKALREQQPDIKVLYMSAYPAHNLDERGQFVQADSLLAKPFTRHALKQKMLDILSAGPPDCAN